MRHCSRRTALANHHALWETRSPVHTTCRHVNPTPAPYHPTPPTEVQGAPKADADSTADAGTCVECPARSSRSLRGGGQRLPALEAKKEAMSSPNPMEPIRKSNGTLSLSSPRTPESLSIGIAPSQGSKQYRPDAISVRYLDRCRRWCSCTNE